MPDLVPGDRVERALAPYTLGDRALAIPSPYGCLGDAAGPSWAAVAVAGHSPSSR